MPAPIARSDLIQGLQELAEELGHPPTSTEMADQGPYSRDTYRREFGSWGAALEAAGFEPDPHQYGRIPDEVLLEELHRVADELGEVPSAPQLRAEGRISERTYRNRFGSWNDALRTAGFEPNERMHIPEEELIAALHEVAAIVDDVPRPVDVQDHGEFSLFVYYHRFGSWEEALAAAGYEPHE